MCYKLYRMYSMHAFPFIHNIYASPRRYISPQSETIREMFPLLNGALLQWWRYRISLIRSHYITLIRLDSAIGDAGHSMPIEAVPEVTRAMSPSTWV